ncbi:hypothetical protein KFK09_010475 [Dendrobium nobile]|uniref:Uncharacterized protein n=1 Tax=Dendrobium nobile TaxID=94219 RepID=A0A8T3BFQ9_DENNO|nr:hypothetical protein KFK09_010475 [Dendrobium nobile]
MSIILSILMKFAISHRISSTFKVSIQHIECLNFVDGIYYWIISYLGQLLHWKTFSSHFSGIGIILSI